MNGRDKAVERVDDDLGSRPFYILGNLGKDCISWGKNLPSEIFAKFYFSTAGLWVRHPEREKG
jgi:hypothetical protein